MTTTRAWLVTGASKGFGKALVEAIAKRGEPVAGTFRDANQARAFEQAYPGIATGVLLDVTDAAGIVRVVDHVLSRFGHLDVLVNNAGYGQFGAVEDLSDQQIRKLMDTNFFGLLNMTRAVLPHFRARRSGRIVNISSVAGFSAYGAGAATYSASKFAVEGLSEAMALELAPLGIGITLVEPGSFRTEFGAASMDMSAGESADYAALLGPVRMYLQHKYHGTEPGDPVKAAQAILTALDAPEPPARLVLGADAVSLVRKKLEVVAEQVNAWEKLSLGTGFD